MYVSARRVYWNIQRDRLIREVRDFSLGILLVFCAIFCDFLESKQAGYILLNTDIIISSRLSTLSLLRISY